MASSLSSKLPKRDGSADGNKRTGRISVEESNQINKVVGGIVRSNTTSSVAFGTNIGDAVIGEDSLSLITKISRLEKDLERRKTSYASREDAYKERVASLEEELSSQKKGPIHQQKKTESKLQELKAIQSEILESVEMVQDRTARIMQEQERDLLRSFRARLFDVQTELEKEKSKKDDGLVAWRERFTQLEAELDWATEVSHRLDKVNASLTEENNELKLKFSSQEQDRKLFIELLVSLKKDNALWRSKNAEIIAENERLKTELSDQLDQISNVAASAPMGGGSKAFQAAALAVQQTQQQQRAESEERYKDVNVRLRRLVAEERKNLQQLRQTYAQELKTRTEMEVLLRRCVDDVRQDIAEMHHEAAQFSQNNTGSDLARLYNAQAGAVPFDDFDAEEHKQNLELLLSQERVVALVYAKTFPIAQKPTGLNVDRGARVVGIGMPSKPVSALRGGFTSTGPNNNMAIGSGLNESSVESGADRDRDMVMGSHDEFSGRPLTTGAMAPSSKFPPIASASGQSSSRLASR